MIITFPMQFISTTSSYDCRGGGTIVDARQRFWLVDSKGLITRSRADAESLPDHVLPYCHEGPGHADLASAVAALKPSVLIGISEGGQGIPFCQTVCQRLATAHDRPIIMPLSLPGRRPSGTQYIFAAPDASMSLLRMVLP